MKHRVCECAETRRNLERERERESNKPGGVKIGVRQFITFSLFCMLTSPLHAGANCSGMSGTSISSGVFNGFRVIVPIWDGNNNYNDNKYQAGQDCSYTNRNWCRICYPGTASNNCKYAYANRCGTSCEHLERYGCSGNNGAQQYKLVGSTRSCKDGFFFGPYVDNQLLGSGIDDVYGETFGPNDIANTDAAFITDTSCKRGDGQAPGNGYNINTADCSHEWNTSNCKFNDRTQVRFYGTYNGVGPWNCQKGTIKWSANPRSGGDAAKGFFLRFSTSSATYTCQECRFGFTNNNNGGPCSCTMQGADCAGGCIYGYTRQGNSCVLRPHFTCNGNVCYCDSGFDADNGCSNCKEGFISQGDNCVCPQGYTLNDNGTAQNTEDDHCVIGGQLYEDSTGWFSIPEGAPSCVEQ
ncbi:MAG: hypothetical protein K6B71_02275 [Alphaproteobacteria bacterium]|nr:hypothetical protein [Alphaproteobacteria bacterium]